MQLVGRSCNVLGWGMETISLKEWLQRQDAVIWLDVNRGFPGREEGDKKGKFALCIGKGRSTSESRIGAMSFSLCSGGAYSQVFWNLTDLTAPVGDWLVEALNKHTEPNIFKYTYETNYIAWYNEDRVLQTKKRDWDTVIALPNEKTIAQLMDKVALKTDIEGFIGKNVLPEPKQLMGLFENSFKEVSTMIRKNLNDDRTSLKFEWLGNWPNALLDYPQQKMEFFRNIALQDKLNWIVKFEAISQLVAHKLLPEEKILIIIARIPAKDKDNEYFQRIKARLEMPTRLKANAIEDALIADLELS